MIANKKIIIEFVDITEQRYITAGDYYETEESYHFKITRQPNPKWNFLILMHEMIEYALASETGITEEQIMEYDLKWEERNAMNLTLADEPGDEPDNDVYSDLHRIAENFERFLAGFMGVDWFEYDRNIIPQLK